MNPIRRLTSVCLAALSFPAVAAVSEVDQEFFTTGDFNGDGKVDVAIVDRYSGRVRIGYQLSPDFFDWANWKSGGLKDVSWVAVGKLVVPNRDALCLVSADTSLITIVDAVNPNADSDPVKIASTALGPNTVAAIDVGGPGNTPLADLYIASIYNNDPTPNLVTLFRSAGKTFNQLAELPVAGVESRASAVALKAGGAEFVAVMSSGEEGDALLVKNLASGKPEDILSIGDLPVNADYVVGNFRAEDSGLKEFVCFKSGEPTLTVHAISESAAKFQAAAAKTFTLDRPVRALLAVDGGNKTRLLAVFGEQEPAELMDFDGVNPPVTVQQLEGVTNKFLNGAVVMPHAVLLFSSLTNGRPVAHYQMYTLQNGSYVAGATGWLASLADRDDSTVPEIHQRIVANQVEKSPADMKPYTNAIPGTEVKYEMVPIPGGEFVMGSPEGEQERQKDEGPQHRVKLAPFWMGRYEVTWDAYLLFMYPDDERKLRETHPTDEAVNAVCDVVTRPSKPYVDMSFGMGKSGFPAISMTQHAANKFCHWLSCKTGHFYRLPTEAEWEYACRAGTTTAYYFGDDPAKLEQYAWFFDNSNSKYQKVGRKKPNPWGLYDMHGNVTEWVLDQYDPDYYQKFDPKNAVTDPWNKATKPYPHSARGGSWDDDPPALRSAARRGSDRMWKMTDPQLPKSIWYLSDAQFVGFRIVRPLAVPPPEAMAKYWISGVEKD